MRTVVLDPGHGGVDPGAIGARSGREADTNLAVALALRDVLERRPLLPGEWIRVTLTRETDAYVSLGRRVDIAHLAGAELLVSIHCNAAETSRASGWEVWTSVGETPADTAATAIWDAFRAACPDRRGRLDMSDGDVDMEGPFAVLTHTRCPAVLVELGFASNPREDELLASEAGRNACVEALAAGIRTWLVERTELVERR